MEHVDRVAYVESFAQPARHRRPRVQGQSRCDVLRSESPDGISRDLRRRRDVGQHPAVRSPEMQRAVRLALDLASLLVDRTMMTTAQIKRLVSVVGPPWAQ